MNDKLDTPRVGVCSRSTAGYLRSWQLEWELISLPELLTY